MAIIKIFLINLIFCVGLTAATICVSLALMPDIVTIFVILLLLILVGGYISKLICKNITNPAVLFIYFSNYVIVIAIPLLFLLLLGFAFSNNHPWDNITERMISICFVYGVCSSASGVFIGDRKRHRILYWLNVFLAICFFVGFCVSSAMLISAFGA